MHRIIAFARSPASSQARQQVETYAEALQAAGCWREVSDRRGFRLFLAPSVSDLDPIIVANGRGMVVGALFHRVGDEHESVREVTSETAAQWCESAGAALTREYWGGYLALLGDRDKVFIVRDPGGARPIFVTAPDAAGVRIIFTHAADFVSIAPLPQLDDRFLAMFLAQPRLVTDRTAFEGVREVLAGECMILDSSGVTTPLAWRPPRPDRTHRRTDKETLARELRAVVVNTVRVWANTGVPIVHRLSGGLDSSIVLASLLAEPPYPDIRCVTEAPDGYPEGDESELAQRVADRLGAPLSVARYRPEDLRYEMLANAPLSAKPSLTELSFADSIFLRAIEEADGVRLLTSGQGGDQVFYRSNPLCLPADAVRDLLGPADVLRVALNSARASRRSVWPFLRAAIEFGMLRSVNAYIREVLGAVSGSNEAIREFVLAEALEDEWVRAATRRGPGEAMRALHLADLQYYHGPSLLAERFVLAPVLTSQPIVEFCCSIPAYRTVDGGRDRGLARLAFASDLPPSAVDRRRKGNTTRFFNAVAHANGAYIQDMLRGGELYRRGLFDLAALDQIQTTAILDFSQHIVAELWLRRVRSVQSAFQGPGHCAPS